MIIHRAREPSARTVTWIVILAITLGSGCYLVWPDYASPDSGIPDARTEAPMLDGGPECTEVADCVTKTTPGCGGIWRCEEGTCAFTCSNCQDGDGDGYGIGQGCLGPDCDDTRKEIFPGEPEQCDGHDNNCNGQIDEGLGILTCGYGACRIQVDLCIEGKRQNCTPEPGAEEFCGGLTALDEDCDAQIDELCPCEHGATQACYSGPSDQQDTGECTEGIQMCLDGSWGPCMGDVGPVVEVCDGKDNDCDGASDEDLQPIPCELTLGVCAGSLTETCNGAQGWKSCTAQSYGSAYESEETSCDDKDNDCDGSVDEGCACSPDGRVRVCGTSQGGCQAGTQVCSNGTWQTCTGATAASAEVCDGVDNDCNGLIDEGFDGDGDAFTICGTVAGGGMDPLRKDCADGNLMVHPGAQEICNGLDDDCDGLIDEALLDKGTADGGPGGGGADAGAPGSTEIPYGVCSCGNGLDDDGDGQVDAADPGCTSLGDNSERGVAACDDGKDNDGDGQIDYPADPGCSGPGDTDEQGGLACDDGLDNDGDGTIDYRSDGSGDPGCYHPADEDEHGADACDDGDDNDGDGKIDFKADDSGDPGCDGPADTSESGLDGCDNGLDDDGDGATDYRIDGSGDPGCAQPADPDEHGTAACDDGQDNDGDGKTDYKKDGSGDPECSGPEDVSED